MPNRICAFPILGDDDDTANRAYIKNLVLENDAAFGKKYGVQYAEGFHYIAPERSQLDEYIKKNAVPISR